MKAERILEDRFEEMTEMLKKAIAFDTQKAKAEKDAPFGRNNADCLDFVLRYAESVGLQTYNCDGYAGHADFVGTGKEVLGILGHLDVVPAKKEDGWTYPPFGGEIHDGKLYGRGAMDDKGPMIACLFAVQALKEEGFVPKKTVRLIFGCDEESGMECVRHYFSKMPFPDVSFSPDGDFPVINREKGIFQFDILCGKLNEKVQSITAGERTNVVADFCKAVLADGTEISAVGRAAHGSAPQDGVNATWQVFEKLHERFPKDAAFAFLAEKATDFTGKKWHIDLQDEPSGPLTCNVGVVRVTEGELVVSVDVRFPVTYTCAQMEKRIRENTPFAIRPAHVSEPLYVEETSDLVTTLLSVYNEKTGQEGEAIAIGGGTYSRSLPNCVAFGPLFPQEEQTIHMPDEYIILDNFRRMSQIYLAAIRRLSEK